MRHSEFAKLLLDSGSLPAIEYHPTSRWFHNQRLWVYKTRSALWEPIDLIGLEKIVYETTKKYTESHQETETISFNGVLTGYFVKDVSSVLMYMVVSHDPFNTRTDLLPLADRKVFDSKTKELSERRQEHRFTYSLPVQYDHEADPTQIEKFFTGDEKKEQKLQKILRGCLENGLLKKRIYFWGPDSVGTTTFFRLILSTCYLFVSRGSDDRDLVRMVFSEEEDPTKRQLMPICQIVRSYSSHPPEDGIEFMTRFVQEPVEVELKRDIMMTEKICTEENKSAFLNWILQ